MEGNTLKPALSKYLIIDTGGFIKNAALPELGQNLITMHEVVDEIRDKETKHRLQALPYTLEYLEADPESIKFVTDFSRKTGDYASLSATDIKIIALTYMMEKRHVGLDHLKQEPSMKKTVEFYHPGQPKDGQAAKIPAGFYSPDGEDLESNDEALEDIDEKDSEQGMDDEGIEEDDDEEGWITPSNLKSKRLEMLGINAEAEDSDKEIIVACLTTDFAMQNVLKQIGLHVLSADGVVIRETKTWILRCYACFATCPKMDKVFCPKCGNKTLKRVSVTLNADGTQQIHISTRRPLSTRGKKFSLPKPQGGKYAVNPIMTADQRIPQQRKSTLARTKTNALNDDYVAGNAPFSTRDVNSRSAMLGIGQGDHYWAKKNPNAGSRKTGNRKNRH